ncbi:aminotransferase-like domain-containing protein [Aliamphritea hakodatensis]|uniref:aminotransferase-like domain-containing protein n=1 Tax=Aliamphritea hakodatensis TaxID=2895352 RepID=UPI0022FD5066|nr:PLP-dependent aminotransferase family protein [Aliamphritea hakodatensis]
MALYREVAGRIQQQIDSGLFSVGERLPGVRKLSQSMDVSVSTVVQAQRLLEDNGVIAARPRSGFYVCQPSMPETALPAAGVSAVQPVPVTTGEVTLFLGQLSQQKDCTQLGFAIPHTDFLPMRALQKSLGLAVRQFDERAAGYTSPGGNEALKQQIARRMRFAGSEVDNEDILITGGAQEALTLALRSIAEPGDVIAIESPTYYGLLQAVESLGMKAIEVATDPVEGISLPALEMAARQWPVKACLLMPNFQNPLGARLSDDNKDKIIRLAERYDFMLIEDDIYGELSQTDQRPCSLHSYDDCGRVIYYSSFSKTVSPGLRIGWLICPPALRLRLQHLKQILNLSSNSLAQLALTDYLQDGGYERHLREVRLRYREQIQRISQAVIRYFPEGTRISQPCGGYVLWVELVRDFDTLALCQRLFELNISIAPGQLFSANKQYLNCLRLNCAQPWNAALDQALFCIGREAEKLLGNG